DKMHRQDSRKNPVSTTWHFPALHVRGHFAATTPTPPVRKHEVHQGNQAVHRVLLIYHSGSLSQPRDGKAEIPPASPHVRSCRSHRLIAQTAHRVQVFPLNTDQAG